MAKDTVRYPDEVVDEIDRLVEDGMFESKSEFYRFSAEYVLTQIDPDHEVETFNFEEIKSELEITGPDGVATTPDGEAPFFLEAVIRVRRAGLRGNDDDALEFIDSHYDPTDREALLLEEVLDQYRNRE